MFADERYQALKQIRDDVINLKESPLYAYRIENNYYPVIGQGDHYAKIMFIGEAPGENEAKTGRPFCGASGRVLDTILESIELEREHVYITNVVKDRPPKNRDPHKDEIALYTPFLERQIDIIQPRVFATLGRFSMEFILKLFDSDQKKGKISQLHGQVIPVTTSYGEAHVVPLYHPAVALYKGNDTTEQREDIKVLKQFL
ncbi:MAG: type-4 uracil-DNA glycosylase [Phototrophicaceae bacterium]